MYTGASIITNAESNMRAYNTEELRQLKNAMRRASKEHESGSAGDERGSSKLLCARIEELSERRRIASLELREYLGLPKPPVSFDKTLIRAPVDDERVRKETKAQMQFMRDEGLDDR